MPKQKRPIQDDVEVVRLNLPLDRDTVSWLSRMSGNDVEAGKMVASILKMIRQDDESAHATHH